MKKSALFVLFILMSVFATPADKWIDQIQILMTEQEKNEYRKLKSDSEKQKFLEDFWARRDPSPGTPENEYKANFEKNFAQVNTMMKDDRGFESDMGQTLLLLGPPTERKEEKGGAEPAYSVDEEEETEAAPGRQTWIYKKLPPAVASGEVKIEFEPGVGKWRFADRKQMQSILEKARQNTIDAAKKSAAAIAKKEPEAKLKPVAGEALPVTSAEVKTALDATATGAPPAEIAMKSFANSFMTSTGETFSAFAIQTDGSPAGAKAGVRVIDSTGKVVAETELPFVDPAANPAEPAGYFQTSLPVRPGEYSVIFVVASDGKTGGAKNTMVVPDYSGKFGMSSIILSKGHTPISEAKPEKTPYTFGKVKLDPNVNRTFSKTDDLFIVYEAYNFQLDSGGKPNVEVSIGFQKGNEPPKQIPPGPANGLVVGKKMTIPTGFSLSEKLFTPGEWKILITLTDKISGQKAAQEASFTIQ
jgi:GWxTD domain-containing protein